MFKRTVLQREIWPFLSLALAFLSSSCADVTEPVDYTLTVTVVGDGAVVSRPSGINASGPGSYNSVFGEGTVVTLTASPAAGSSLKEWGGACTGEEESCTITISSDQTISVEFEQDAVVTVVLDGGVVSSLPEGTTTVKTGEEISYSFSTEGGWTDLAVWINGETSPVSGNVEARDTVTFLASALPEPQPLTQEESDLAEERRSLAQAPSAEAFLLAAEGYLRKLNSAGALDSPEELDRIRAEVFDPNSYEQLAILNGLLRGSRIFFRDGQLVGLGNSGVSSPAPPFGPEDTWVPVFINGIHTDPTDALENLALLSKTLQASGFGGGVELWYNPTFSQDVETRKIFGCFQILTPTLSPLGTVRAFLKCVRDNAVEIDLIEAALEIIAVSTGMDAIPSNDDAEDFAAWLQASLSKSSHLEFFTHSQGNLVLQEALRLTEAVGANPPLCFGVTGIAEPVSGQVHWPLSTGRYQSIIAEDDGVLVLGKNNSPRIKTQLSGELSKALDALELRWYDFVLFSNLITKPIARLVVEAYYRLKIHSFSAYLADSDARQAIDAAVANNVQGVRARTECSSPEVENIIPIGDGTPGEDFDTDGGSFSLAVAPVDPQGKLQVGGLTVNNFSFANVRAISLTGSNDVSGEATATDVIPEVRTADAIDLMMVFDASGSMRTSDPDRRSLAAGQVLLTHLRANDRVGVMRFSSNVTLLQELTTDHESVSRAIVGITFGGTTALYQAVISGSNLLAGKAVPTLVVLSDGGNNVSPLDRSQAVAAATNIGASVYGIGLGSGSAVDNIRALAVETGGVYAHASDATGLALVYDAIAVGVSQGRLVIRGEGHFDTALSTGLYRVEGDLITSIGSRSFTTPWKFEVEIR